MINNIDHIAIAVSNMNESLHFWRDILGLEIIHSEEIRSQRVNTVFFQIGNSKIELIEAIDEDNGIARFLSRGGSAIHHIALEVENISEMLSHLNSHGVKVINDAPVKGADNKLAVFVHPDSTSGVLLEFYESQIVN